MSRPLFIFLALVVFMLPYAQAAEPAIRSEALAQAATIVAEALRAEAAGDFLTRQRLLVEAEQISDFAPAKWHRGQLLQSDGSWADVQTSIQAAAKDSKLAQYEQRRASLPDNMGNHLAIATWCAEQGLFDQCRSHLNRVLAFDPEHAVARRALGYQSMGGEWISPQQATEFMQRANRATESIHKYGKPLQSILTKVSSNERRQIDAGTAELAKLTDPIAIPAVEAILASPSPEISKFAIDWLAQVDAVESSQALARFSLAHPMPMVRGYAATKLKLRPLHDFVPDMLEMLSSPVSMMIVPSFNRDGSLSGYRQAFAQEKFDKTDIVFIDREFPRERIRANDQTLVRGRDNLRAFSQEMNQMIDNSLREFAAGETSMRSAAIQRANQDQEQRNARISQILSEVAEREFSGDANEMWRWWDNYNETKYQEYKPQRYQRSGLTERVPQYQVSCECFVAGTPVMTSRGLRAIERIVVGDRVLSRNVVSGELSWKPVLRATTRPPDKTDRIGIGDEQFQCSTGHLFWVSGQGWKKASQLEPGDILHAAEEPMVVTQVSEAPSVPTFNLEVADNSNYFVGKAMILTHDVTARGQNRQLVPGD